MEDIQKAQQRLVDAIVAMHPQLCMGDEKQEELYLAMHDLTDKIAKLNGCGGECSHEEKAALPLHSVSNSASSCSFKEVKDIWNAAEKHILHEMGEICKGDANYEEDTPDLNTYYERHYY